MPLKNQAFESLIANYTTQHERIEAEELQVVDIQFHEELIQAHVEDDKVYMTSIAFSPKKVTNAMCTCYFDKAGYCKHIIATLRKADELMLEENQAPSTVATLDITKEKNGFTIHHAHILELDEQALNASSISLPITHKWEKRLDLRKAEVKPQLLVAHVFKGYEDDWMVRINQSTNDINAACTCFNPSKKLCEHIHFTLLEIHREDALKWSFNDFERQQMLFKHANNMGLKDVENPDDLFELTYEYNRLHIHAKYTMLSLSDREKEQLKKQLLPSFHFPKAIDAEWKEFIVVEESSFTKQLIFTLYKATTTKAGELKSPLEKVNITDKMRVTRDPDQLLFLAALLQQDAYKEQHFLYGDLIKNPYQLPIYYHTTTHDNKKVLPRNIEKISLKSVSVHAQVSVKQSGDFYVLVCNVEIENTHFSTRTIQLIGSFFFSGNNLYFIQNETILQVIKFFKSKNHEVFVHQTQFSTFREEFLEPLEDNISVQYSFVKKAPAKLIKERSLNKITEHLIYLSESEDYILITPVIMYGETEVNVLSKKTVLTENPDGTLYSIDRQFDEEQTFIDAIRVEHRDFDQEQYQPFFYLHKNAFLDGQWFLDVFERWREKGYSILGFNQLRNNRYNSSKIKVSTQIKSGIDWFDTEIKVNFGKVEANLRDIQKAVTNKSRYVQLGDGSLGVLPEEWIRRFSNYFRHGELTDKGIRTHKSNFQIIDQLYDDAILTEEIRSEINLYRKKMDDFREVAHVQIPSELHATLRDYQKEGLNWLNFLDEFGFGGVLADDMGLGKTIQIITYILLQKEKGRDAANLVVVPTSLLFNWQRELEKFAPTLRFIVLHGTNRPTIAIDYNEYDVVITTYGTMLSDIEFLKKVHFNLLILDESQAIKNPSSKRYKAARLLKGRQRIAVTGTPVENNTFDLYAQLSFAMPGLLGSAKRFADDFAIPIDKFQDTQRAKELQKKIHPFILRRTKQQVAKELPAKTEMVIYCEMDTEQKRVYDSYKIEFQKYLAGLSTEELHSSSLHVLQGLTKLRQICNSPALLSDKEYYGDQSAKLVELMEQVRTLKDQHKIVIFSQFVGMLELIKPLLDKEKIEYAYLTGQTKNREAEVQKFQKQREVRVFLVSLKAGGVGLNLTEAEYVFLIDPWWNPAVENQAIDRAHRIGQKNKVVAVRLITPGTIEEKILELQHRKKELSNELIHTDNSILKDLTKDDLLQLL